MRITKIAFACHVESDRQSQKTTIAHLVTGLQIGGLERVVINLVGRFRDSGYRQFIVCLETGGPFADEIAKLGANVIVLGKKPGMSWRTIRQLATLFRQEHVQIVHTHNPPPHFHGVLAGLLAGVPVRVHTKHGRNYPHMKKRVLLNRVLSWFTDAIVPVSDNAGTVALEIEKVNPKKVWRIWNGVDTELYRPQSTVHRPQSIATVARLSPEKDQQTMLLAFRLVVDQLPAARLVFIGDGPCLPVLRDTTAKLKLTGHVEFLGARNDVAALLPEFTVFTLSSVTEGISMTLLEAMACGVPIVATDVGGNREIVQPPACGLIVPARDPQALATAYLELLRDLARCAKMGAAGRQRVVEHFSLESMVRQYSDLYDELLKRKIA
ncbi:MAG: Glycosyltransferase Gtf1 [Verrucomicrobiae bacterium]|nr:Glycosyltransferase Gtf1 [Verrucomicrobiae bacterium]